MFSIPRTLKLEGQEFIFNDNSNTITLEITQPFFTAGNKLNWDSVLFGNVGFGINRSIYGFIQSKKTRLAIIILSEKNDVLHWISWDRLKDFKKNNRTEYSISGKTLHVFPWKLFGTIPSQVDEL